MPEQPRFPKEQVDEAEVAFEFLSRKVADLERRKETLSPQEKRELQQAHHNVGILRQAKEGNVPEGLEPFAESQGR